MRRGRDLEQILTQYTTFVKPAFEEFCLPVPVSLAWGPLSSLFKRTLGALFRESRIMGERGLIYERRS